MAPELPQGARLVEISAHYNETSIPREFMRSQPLPDGLWGKLIVEEGEILLVLEGSSGGEKLAAESETVIPPETAFRIAPTGVAARFYLQYYHPAILDDPEELANSMGR